MAAATLLLHLPPPSSCPPHRLLHHHSHLLLSLSPPHPPSHPSHTPLLAPRTFFPRSFPPSTTTTTPVAAFTCMASSHDPAAPSPQPESSRPTIGLLFVCLGNICRSPTAEAVFRYAIEKRGLASQFNVDSAGTINYHEGEPADARMKAAARKRGVQLTSISRPIRPSDFEEFDFILAMDRKNKEDILKAYDKWSTKEKLPLNGKEKVELICSYCKNHKETEVPDPYYGGPDGFEKVLDLLEDACESLLDLIVANSMKNKEIVKGNT